MKKILQTEMDKPNRFCSPQQTKNYEYHVPIKWQPQTYLDNQRSKIY